MSTWGVTGGAGTGKTTRLLARLDEHLASHPLGDGQRVLALARYHGARFRLIDKLAQTSARGRADCFTFDRFAWRLCSRWRSRLRERGLEPSVRAFDETCAAAGSLLADGDVARWVTSRYPVVVVDELQDCRDGRLAIVQRLAGTAFVAVAADGFQDLGSTEENPAVTWMRESDAVEVEELTLVHRTDRRGLLEGATAARAGAKLLEGSGLRVIAMPAPHVAASYITQAVAGLRGSVAIITPTRPDKSAFVRDVVRLVSTERYPKPPKTPKGPYPIAWEASTEAAVAEYEDGRGLTKLADEAVVSATQLLDVTGGVLDRPMREWVDRQRRLRGAEAFTCSAVRAEVQAAAQRLRGVTRRGPRRVAMTVHQAKNREFPVVFVLWPREVRKDSEASRRLLYNAITRAKEQAYVIVHGDDSRLSAPPFAVASADERTTTRPPRKPRRRSRA